MQNYKCMIKKLSSNTDLFCSLSVHVRDQTRNWNPEKKTDEYNGSDNVVLEKFDYGVDVEIVDEIPNSSDDILHGLFALTHVAKSLIARCSVWQAICTIVLIRDWKASRVQIATTASDTQNRVH